MISFPAVVVALRHCYLLMAVLFSRTNYSWPKLRCRCEGRGEWRTVISLSPTSHYLSSFFHSFRVPPNQIRFAVEPFAVDHQNDDINKINVGIHFSVASSC